VGVLPSDIEMVVKVPSVTACQLFETSDQLMLPPTTVMVLVSSTNALLTRNTVQLARFVVIETTSPGLAEIAVPD